MQRAGTGKAILAEIPPVGGYLALLVVLTWPLLPNLGSAVVGDAGCPDFIGHIWHCRWLADSVFEGRSPYQVHTVLFPVGAADFVIKSGVCLNAALTVPLQAVMGVVASFNLTVFALGTLTAWAGYRLALAISGDRAASFLAGALFLANPMLYAELSAGHMDQYSGGWCLLALWMLLRIVRRPGWWAPALTGVFFALTTISFLGYGLLLALFALLAVGWSVAARRSLLTRSLVIRLAVAAAVFGVLLSPVVGAYLSQDRASEASGATGVTFPLTQVPQTLDRLAMTERIMVEESIRPLEVRLRYTDKDRGLLPQLHLSVLVLAGIGLVLARRKGLLWAVGAALFAVLSCGPYLRGSPGMDANATAALAPMPAALLLDHVPFFGRFRFPYRFLFMTAVCLCPLVALGARILLKRARVPTRLRVPVMAGLVGVVMAETIARGMLPSPAVLSTFPPVPRYYSEVLAHEPDGAILNIPFLLHKPTMAEERSYPTLFWQSYEMHHHGVHGKRILSGLWVAFAHPETHAWFVRTNTLVRNIQGWQRNPRARSEPVDCGDLWTLEQLGFRWVIVNNDWLWPEATRSIHRGLAVLYGDPRFESDGNLTIYDMTATGPARHGTSRSDRIDLDGQAPLEPSDPGELQRRFVRNPDDLDGWLSFVDELEKQGRFGKALDTIDEARSFIGEHPHLSLRQGQLLEARGLPSLALQAYREVESLDPSQAVDTRHLEAMPAVHRPVVDGGRD